MMARREVRSLGALSSSGEQQRVAPPHDTSAHCWRLLSGARPATLTWGNGGRVSGDAREVWPENFFPWRLGLSRELGGCSALKKSINKDR